MSKKRTTRKPARKVVRRRVAKLIPPAIGAVWKGQGGVYAGIVRGRDGDADCYLIIGPEASGGLTFDAANKFCAEQKVDGHTDFTGMYRREQSVAFGNVPELFQRTWYWSREQHESYAVYAWYQYFGDGGQGHWRKDTTTRVRAVRRFPIQSFTHSVIGGAK